MAGKRVAAQKGTENLILLFADVKMEHPDLYRFLPQAAASIGGKLVTISDGRDPWQVFFDKRYLGNSRIDPCSRILKRELLKKWLKENTNPKEDTYYIGIDWTESHRLDRVRNRNPGFNYQAPLCDPPYLSKAEINEQMRAEGIPPPILYEQGFPHNNCGGFCVKAGQAQFALLLRVNPELYAYHERREQELREYLNKNVSILRDRRGGKSTPLTLRTFRLRIEHNNKDYDEEEWGGCGCALA